MALETVPLRQLEMNIITRFVHNDELDVIALDSRMYNDTGASRIISKVRASVGIAATGADVQIDIRKNGTSILPSSTYLTVADGTNTATINVPANTVWAEGEYLTIDIVQVGSTFAGEALVVDVITSE